MAVPEGNVAAGGRLPEGAAERAEQGRPFEERFRHSFKLSLSGQETLVLARPDGTILDRMPLFSQYGGVSYGRISGKDGFFYLGSQTPGAVNTQTACLGRVPEVMFGALA